MNVLLLGGAGVAPLESVVREAGHRPTVMGTTYPTSAVLIAAAAGPGDWYTAGTLAGRGAPVCVFGIPCDEELGDMTRALTPADVQEFLQSVPSRMPNCGAPAL